MARVRPLRPRYSEQRLLGGTGRGGRGEGKRGGLLFHPTSENYNGAAQPQHVIKAAGFLEETSDVKFGTLHVE
jgi:hypothetical protein